MMGDREKEKGEGEGPRRIMVNSDEDIIEALKEINKTLPVKERRTIICKDETEHVKKIQGKK